MGMHDTGDTERPGRWSGGWSGERSTAWSTDGDDGTERVDWAASCRLALVVSIVAALVALCVVSLVGETTSIVMVIVAATATSWFHLEQGRLTRVAQPARVRD